MQDGLPGLEFAEFTAFEEDLERRPDEGCSRLCTVDGVVPEGEACADGLVDVDHCKQKLNIMTRVNCYKERWVDVLLLMLFQLLLILVSVDFG